MIRILVWSLLGVLILAGARAAIFPQRVSIAEVTAGVEKELGIVRFPVEQGQGLAVRFLEEYLTYDPGLVTERNSRLSEFYGDGIALPLTDAAARAQVLTGGPLLAGDPQLIDANHAVYTFAVRVADPAAPTKGTDGSRIVRPWRYIAVSVYADGQGAVSIAGMPAYTTEPVRATGNGAFTFTVDEASSEAFKSDAALFFRAWGASNADELKRFEPADRTDAVHAGLNGQVTFKEVVALRVEAGTPGTPRYAEASVLWDTDTIPSVSTYRMTVLQGTDGLWYVRDISPAGFGN